MGRLDPNQEWITDRADGAVVSVLVSPKSSVNKVGPIEGNELRVYVTAPPADGAANAAVVKMLAQTFGVPKSRIEIVSGHSSRHKRVKFHGVSAIALVALLEHIAENTA